MTSIADTLSAEHVTLELAGANASEAIENVAELLRHEATVNDWEKFFEGVKSSAPCAAERGCEFGICIPHARTDAVSKMVMSAGRATPGINFAGCVKPIRYVFCIGVPKALDADYLRIVGLLARILKDASTEKMLHEAESPAEFVEILARLEAKL